MKLSEDEQKLESLRGMYGDVGFPGGEAWKKAPVVHDGHALTILGHPVMEDWEHPYMKRLAEIASKNGGRVLEIGFGLGIAASYIQQTKKVKEHIIIEANHEIAEMARAFCKTAHSTAHVIEGLWEDVIDQITDGTLDGILHDAYPLDESEVMGQVHFAKTAHRKLKTGGVFTYFSDEAHRFRDDHLHRLLDAGFQKHNIQGEVVEVNPPESCRYWNIPRVLAPTVVK
jgi:guanidinoacetate N-methyltransferase